MSGEILAETSKLRGDRKRLDETRLSDRGISHTGAVTLDFIANGLRGSVSTTDPERRQFELPQDSVTICAMHSSEFVEQP
jgi:hypothetical protein